MEIENASNALNKKRNNISAFESNYPREKRKERITKISLCISACIAYFAGKLYNYIESNIESISNLLKKKDNLYKKVATWL